MINSMPDLFIPIDVQSYNYNWIVDNWSIT